MEQQLAVCAVFRDEAPYIQEWIEFHLAQGVSKFFLFDDSSTDNFKAVLSAYQSSGLVHLEPSVEGDQVKTYERGLQLARGNADWLAFLDLDEFLYAKSGLIVDALPKSRLVAGCFVYWKMFGTNGRVEPSPLGVLEGFTSSLPLPQDIGEVERIRQVRQRISGGKEMSGSPFKGKTIVRPERVFATGAHFPTNYRGVILDEAGRWWRSAPTRRIGRRRFGRALLPTEHKLIINHYWSKSESEILRKAARPRISEVRRGPLEKALPSEQVAYGRWLNQRKDFEAAQKRRAYSSPFVFVIGFNRTATKTIFRYFRDNGFPGIHWDGGRLARTMKANVESGRPVFYGYDSEFRVFADLTYLSESDVIEGNAYFREMARDYPDAFFLFQNRDSVAWAESRLKHANGRSAKRWKMALGIEEDQDLVEYFIDLKENFEREVRVFFREHPELNFIELDLSDGSGAAKIEQFLGFEFDHSKWSDGRKSTRATR